MAYNYDDSKDLIQNQRAMAELTSQIIEKFDLTGDVATTLTNNLAALQTSVDNYINACNSSVSTHQTDVNRSIVDMNNKIKALQDTVNTWVLPPGSTAGQSNEAIFNKMYTDVNGLVATVFDRTLEDGVTVAQGLARRFEEIEKRFPGIQIPEKVGEYGAVTDAAEKSPTYGKLVVPLEKRYDKVLYGCITDQVRDLEDGAALRLSPYLQGVIRDLGKG